jgi:membrane fusion protein (multidrug efflux system)
MIRSPILWLLPFLALLSACENVHESIAQITLSGGKHEAHAEGHAEHSHKIVVTTAIEKDIYKTQRYVGRIHSRRHIEVRALEGGYLDEITVREGQMVTKGQLLFGVVPLLYQARLDADLAEADLVRIEYENAKKLYDQKVVSQQEVALAQAKLNKAQAKVKLAKAELDFASIKAPFDGIIDRLYFQQGSLVSEGDVLTTLSDNSEMWVYFNVPEVNYLEYKANGYDRDNSIKIELQLADHSIFPHTGRIGAIEADFNSETGNISFRADFPNPNGLLRHGQTGTVLINRLLPCAMIIPQRATFEILAKRYVYVVGDDNVIHQREVTIHSELDDIFVLREGLKRGERFILEGVRQVRDGEKITYEMIDANLALGQLKNKAE